MHAVIHQSLFRRLFVFCAFFLALAACCGQAALAEPAPLTPSGGSGDGEPALVQADRLAYNEETNVIVADGHVEISQGDQILKADKIVYYAAKDVVHAEGNVAILQPSGEVYFADQAEVTGDMKEGFVDKARVLFPDNSRLAAQDAQRYQGRYLIADRGVYTACELCAKNPEKAPVWQMKAARVTHDNEAHDIIYRDATIEMAGIPVFYTPYFSHPDPTVQRRQGFLTPSGGFSQYLGTTLRIPYYIDIAPNSDAVVMPTFSENDKFQLSSQWRHRFAKGDMDWRGSFTRTGLIDEYGVDQGRQWRGHLFGTTLFNLTNTWRAGTDVAFTSDKSYLRRYNITSTDMLKNRAFIEGFRGRDYAVTNLYYFQDLRPGLNLVEPFVAPEMRVSLLGEPGQTLGGRWSLNAGLLATTRDRAADVTKQGPDTRRVSLDAGWERQFASTTGLLTNLSGFARADGYWADNVPDAAQPLGTGFSNVEDVRTFAQSDLALRYPLGRSGDGYQQILEPIGVLSVAPRVSDRQNLPNEDSLDVEFDETNLFSPNRFTGIDRIEGGIRAAYGLRHALIGDNGARIEMLGGQVFRVKSEKNFPSGSGLRERYSDYVGRLEVSPASWLDANYGFRIDRGDLKFQRQEGQLSLGVPEFRPFINYLSDNQVEATTDIAQHVEEATVGFTSTIKKYYVVTASHTQAFLPDAGPRLTSVGVSYRDECFELGVAGSHTATERADVSSGTTVFVHFYLKNIGGVQTNSASSSGY